MNIADNLNRIKSATDEIKSICDACLDTETDKVEVYPNRLAKAIVDTPAEQTIKQRTLSGIKDGVAYVDKVKGKSIVWNQKLKNYSGNGGLMIATTNNIKKINGITTSQYPTVAIFGNMLDEHIYITYSKYIGGYVSSQPRVNIYASFGKTLLIGDSYIGKPKSGATSKAFQLLTEVGVEYIDYELGIFGIDLTQMFGSGNEPSTPDEFAQRLGYATIDDLPYFEYDEGSLLSFNATSIQSKDADNNVLDNHSFNIADIKDSNGETLFPYGLMSLDDTYDEINGEKAIKRIGYDGTTRTILTTPIEVNLSPYKQYYKVENGGTETLVASGNTTPLIADIGYRSVMSAEELVNTLNDTLNG